MEYLPTTSQMYEQALAKERAEAIRREIIRAALNGEIHDAVWEGDPEADDGEVIVRGEN